MKSTDPNGLNRSAEEAAETARQVLEAIDVPLIVWGSANVEKDTEVLRQVAMACSEKSICLGPVEEASHKQIGAQALAYNHMVIASTPIDINLAKQLNILLSNLGVPDEKIIIDPTTGALGYGIEYSYSVMERVRQAALTQQDEKLQLPMIANLADEVWKVKESHAMEDPAMGNDENRGILIEAITANTFLLAGADILVMRHPKAIQLVRNYIADMAGVERPAPIWAERAEEVAEVPEEAAAVEAVAPPEAAAATPAGPVPPGPASQPMALSVANLPAGMRLDIDMARIMDLPITVGTDYVLAAVKVSEEAGGGGVNISPEVVEALSAFFAAKKSGFFPTTATTAVPVAKKPVVPEAVEVKEEPPAEAKPTAVKEEVRVEERAEKKKGEKPKVEILKTWEVQEDTVGEFEYGVEKKKDFSGKEVELLGSSYEKGKPAAKGDWRQKLGDKDQAIQYLKTGLRYWYSTDWYGSERRKTPA